MIIVLIFSLITNCIMGIWFVPKAIKKLRAFRGGIQNRFMIRLSRYIIE